MEDFELKAFTMSDYGTDIRYRMTEKYEDGTITENDYRVKNTRLVHPDLSRLFDEMTDVVAVVLNRKLAGDIADGRSNIIPSSVTFVGKNDNAGIVVRGSIDTSYGMLAFKTPRLKLSDQRMSAKLNLFADKLSREVREYLNGKTAEMDVL